ncbi:MAG: transcription antitermination factor NusB [Clostridia bacterium]|jgi:N utilization substance protein B|nr:transcription antitermination factor NusB [Clostridia bacterium]MBQ6000385.1 transcription antitermination factor NusB [Clostridia bacterium]
MTRKDARAAAVQLLYEYEFHTELEPSVFLRQAELAFAETFDGYTLRLFSGVLEHKEELDALIVAHSQNWRLERIHRISKTILRLAIFEMLFDSEVETPIAINEAVELSKQFELGESAAFINGVLGGIARGNEQHA